jgi:MFS family permease
VPTPLSPPTLPVLQRRTMRVLVVAQLLGALGLAAGGTAGALLAEQLTGSAAAAGLPLALLVLGSGLGAVATTRLMDRAGRRAGLAAAYLAGAVGAIAGPNLLGPAGTLAQILGLPEPTGLFVLALPAFVGVALVLAVFLRPDPLQVARAAALSTEQSAAAGARGELAALLGDRHLRLALLVLALTNLTMMAVVAVTPVHLHDHGAGTGMVGLMVSAHIAAMYVPSPLTGWLADTLGRQVVAGMGALLLGAGGVAAVAGSGPVGVLVALLLLGVGWNAGLIGGSALLREAPVSPSLRTRAEGLGELGMGAAAAVGGSGAGLLLATGGFALLGLAAAAPCLLVLAATTTVERRPGGVAHARSGSSDTTRPSVTSMPD